MAKLEILEFPDPRLRTVATPIEQAGPKYQQMAADMLETMYDAPGIGLAASQVNIHERLIVVDISEDQDAPLVLLNPTYEVLGEAIDYQEGCLSVPGFYESVTRFDKIHVTAMDASGAPIDMIADDLLAICIQHEIDHLDGKLFVDYLSTLKRTRIRKKLEKSQRDKA
jgi:peptide deformylase